MIMILSWSIDCWRMINCDGDCDSIFLALEDRAIHLSVFFVSSSPNSILDIKLYITFLDIIISILYYVPRIERVRDSGSSKYST